MSGALESATSISAVSRRPADSYNRNWKAVHWLTLLLIAAAYAAICAIHAVAGGDQSALLAELDLFVLNAMLPGRHR
jgi:cytochrome b561